MQKKAKKWKQGKMEAKPTAEKLAAKKKPQKYFPHWFTALEKRDTRSSEYHKLGIIDWKDREGIHKMRGSENIANGFP